MNMNIISNVSGNTTVDIFLLLEDENFIEYYKSLTQSKHFKYNLVVKKLIDWVNNNY